MIVLYKQFSLPFVLDRIYTRGIAVHVARFQVLYIYFFLLSIFASECSSPMTMVKVHFHSFRVNQKLVEWLWKRSFRHNLQKCEHNLKTKTKAINPTIDQ
jgi:hypothetical protein